MKLLQLDQISSPLGTIMLVVDDGAICGLEFADQGANRLYPFLERRYGAFVLEPVTDPDGFSSAIQAYFGGDLAVINALPIHVEGTAFQCRVWAALRTITVGSVLSYGALAAQLGAPLAARAVGAANGQNPISIIVPCHRLVGADRRLVNYGGGLNRKAWLLRHEGAVGWAESTETKNTQYNDHEHDIEHNS